MEDIIVQPNAQADACIIWLHGLGADPSDFLGITSQLGLLQDHKVKFIFPHAPYRNITINQGMIMPGWYDIYSLEFVAKEDDLGILDSSNKITALVDQEINQFGIRPERIILAGFSQGAAIALHSGLRFRDRLGGILGLSGYQLRAASLPSEISKASLQTPIFLAHGLFDPVVPLHLGVTSKEQLEALGFVVNWHTYPMQHTVIPEEIGHIKDFVREILQ